METFEWQDTKHSSFFITYKTTHVLTTNPGSHDHVLRMRAQGNKYCLQLHFSPEERVFEAMLRRSEKVPVFKYCLSFPHPPYLPSHPSTSPFLFPFSAPFLRFLPSSLSISLLPSLFVLALFPPPPLLPPLFLFTSPYLSLPRVWL